MGWERRGNGLYYYHKRRVGRRVVSEYGGHGEVAQAIEALRADDREMQAHLRGLWRQEKADDQVIERQLAETEELVRALVQGVLVTAGYHTHKGQWRKARHA
jgi:hypothetical protein